MNVHKTMDARIRFLDAHGAVVKTLRESVRELILKAESRAVKDGVRTPEAIDRVLREAVAKGAMDVSPLQLHGAIRRLDAMRTGACCEDLDIIVQSLNPVCALAASASSEEPALEGIFEPERAYPDADALALFERLAGIDEQKAALMAEIALAVLPARIEEWSQRHHKLRASTLLSAYRDRVPLVVLQGDVGTGKTALAESVGAAVVRDDVANGARLLKMTGQVRGQGLVGQMSDEIVKAFVYAESRAKALGPDVPLLLLIDEADAIATSRAGEQMHHEDKAGVNTLLQRLDRLKTQRVRPTVIFITNRPGAVDPAIARRAGLILHFERPSLATREAIFASMLVQYGFSAADIKRLARETERERPPYTASDLVDKILVRTVQDAVRSDRPISVTSILAAAKHVQPSPVFGRD